MSGLYQIQMAYDQLQDRLILFLFTQDFSEFRFWLTRRSAKGLWSILTQMLEGNQKKLIQEEKKIEEQIKKEKAQQNVEATKFANRMTQRPLGDEPLLINKISAKQIKTGAYHLHLEAIKGQSIEVNCDNTIVLALCKLIQQSVKQAEWDLELTVD